jgi:cysteine desulfurase/selenocysteine lyase
VNTPDFSSGVDATSAHEHAQGPADGGVLAEITRIARELFAGQGGPGVLAPVVPANVGQAASPVAHLEPTPPGGGASPAAVTSPTLVASDPTHGLYFLDFAGYPAIPQKDAPPAAVPAAPTPVVTGAPVPAASAANAPAARSNPAAAAPIELELGLELFDDAAVAPSLAPTRAPFDPHALRRDFPILEERVHGHRLVWLDNAATTQKPRAVIDRLGYFYEHENSNVHRAAHTLAGRATDAYEAARDKVRRFLNAPSPREVVFVRGGTEAINLVAQSWGRRFVGPGDEIVITWLEHHANIVPWQMLAKEKGAKLRVVPVDERGQVLLEDYERLLGPRTRLVAVTHVSNALGTVVPVREMTAIAHRYGARVLLDGAQAVSHLAVDVQALDCDFYCFSGHKVFAPTGIGALYGKADVLDSMPPWQGGGNMIQDVTFERTTYQPPPGRFEAGTGNIADAVGLGAAIDYVSGIGLELINAHEHELLVYGTECLRTVPGLRLIGTAPDKAGVLSFVLDGQRTEDIGSALDQEGIAVRSGHHCAQPILRRFGLEATVRASLALYNTREDIDALVAALHRLQANRPR